ncbi:MAG: phenylalanine--tRNA ligase subunit beta [Patescibacteria group bacterium]
MKVSHNWLQCYFEKPLPTAEKLAELFTFGAFEVEGIEKVLDAQGKLTDTVIDVKVLPDRAHYALCHRGASGEVSALAGLARKPLNRQPFAETSTRKVEVKNLESKLCARYVTRYVENITVGKTPDWPRFWLEAIGQRSINTVVDATNTVMFDMGQPLHAFDADKVKGPITIRLAKANEKMTTLDGSAGAGKEIELSPEMLVIADDAGVLAVAGVKGGSRAAVTSETKNLILEAACFDPVSVRKTSTKIGIRNESSRRFENEITPHLAADAMYWLTALILEQSKSAKVGPVTDIHGELPELVKMEVSVEQINAMFGVAIPTGIVVDLLNRLELNAVISGGAKGVKGDTFTLTIPYERLDLRIPADIAEEVGRLYGYDKIPYTAPAKRPLATANKTFYYCEKIKNVLIAQGFSEVYGYALAAKGDFEVAKSLAADKGKLRTNLADGMAKSLEMNVRNADLLGLETVAIFEIGTVFSAAAETTSLGLAAQMVKKVKGKKSEDVLNNALEAIAGGLSITLPAAKVQVAATGGALLELNLTSLITTLPAPASYTDLGFTRAIDTKYKPFSAYPFITRDIALFVPAGTDEAAVRTAIADLLKKIAGNLVVKGPDCFDRFEKDGKLSLAYRMIFQSYEKTLSDEEVNAHMTALHEAVKANGWTVR